MYKQVRSLNKTIQPLLFCKAPLLEDLECNDINIAALRKNRLSGKTELEEDDPGYIYSSALDTEKDKHGKHELELDLPSEVHSLQG